MRRTNSELLTIPNDTQRHSRKTFDHLGHPLRSIDSKGNNKEMRQE